MIVSARLATAAEHDQWLEVRDAEIATADGKQINPEISDDPDDFTVYLIPVGPTRNWPRGCESWAWRSVISADCVRSVTARFHVAVNRHRPIVKGSRSAVQQGNDRSGNTPPAKPTAKVRQAGRASASFVARGLSLSPRGRAEAPTPQFFAPAQSWPTKSTGLNGRNAQ
jgi:hypothetical protein